ncbi:hypothetical protein HDU97_001635 [Phlyctochytrium planicorne]|nr:hypothetical protein HDU97_001635 [Phlyctochytrium planicorne]
MSKSSKNKRRNDRRRKAAKAKSQGKAAVATLELETVLAKPTLETTVLSPDSPNLSAYLAKTGSDFSVSPLAEPIKIAEELEGKVNIVVVEGMRLEGFGSGSRISRARYFSQPPLGRPVGDARHSLRSRRHSGDGWDTFTKSNQRTILREAEGESGLTRCGMIWSYMESFRDTENGLLPSEEQCSKDVTIAKVNSSKGDIDINKSEIKALEHEDMEKLQSLKVWNICDVETLLRLDLSDKESSSTHNDPSPASPIIGVSMSIEDLIATPKVTKKLSLKDLFSAATATAEGAKCPIEGHTTRMAQHDLGFSVSIEDLTASASQAIENELDFGSIPEESAKYLCREPVPQDLMNGSLRLDNFLKSSESLQRDGIEKLADEIRLRSGRASRNFGRLTFAGLMFPRTFMIFKPATTSESSV